MTTTINEKSSLSVREMQAWDSVFITDAAMLTYEDAMCGYIKFLLICQRLHLHLLPEILVHIETSRAGVTI